LAANLDIAGQVNSTKAFRIMSPVLKALKEAITGAESLAFDGKLKEFHVLLRVAGEDHDFPGPDVGNIRVESGLAGASCDVVVRVADWEGRQSMDILRILEPRFMAVPSLLAGSTESMKILLDADQLARELSDVFGHAVGVLARPAGSV
jgi:hypothetical protein